MPVPKRYATNAERQAAYRARHADRRPPAQDHLAALAWSLHIVLGDAVRENRCPFPPRILGSRPDETLRNLIYYLDPHPDPVRYFGMEGMPRAGDAESQDARNGNVNGGQER